MRFSSESLGNSFIGLRSSHGTTVRKMPSAQPGFLIERDIRVAMRDGVELAVNAYRPPGEGRVPVVMSVMPYGKDALPDRIGMFFMRLAGVRFGTLDCSPWTGFEAPDPVFWTQAGYAVVQA